MLVENREHGIVAEAMSEDLALAEMKAVVISAREAAVAELLVKEEQEEDAREAVAEEIEVDARVDQGVEVVREDQAVIVREDRSV